MNTPYENLANAIILRAVEDYRKVLRVLSMHPYHRDALREKEVFFASFTLTGFVFNKP